jgi:hypothetical protein
VSQTYPDASVQALTSSWWVTEAGAAIVPGRLIWTLVPFPEMKPYRLVPIGRGEDPRQHAVAEFRIETFRAGDPHKGISRLPVAALPIREGETYVVGRAKRRPAIVVSTGGRPIPRELRQGQNRWQFAPTVLVAPYYGADPSGGRGGWPAPFVERIKRAEYPQYMWDVLPISDATTESILRLDHIMPIGADDANWVATEYALSEEARGLFEQWVSWVMIGSLPAESALGYARSELAKM